MAYAQAPEYALKAAFLYNFAKFIQWPADVFTTPAAPLVLCTFRSDKVESALKRIVKGKTINGRGLAVREIGDISEGKSCQVLFVGAAASGDEASILAAIRNQSVLVVGETPHFARDGGGINFVVQDDRLRFVINLGATDKARLKLSSKLLSLAIFSGN